MARFADSLTRALPFLGWRRTYHRGDLPADLVAGLTTAILLIPQSMAYAVLAGLPPSMGLYASTIPMAIYALWGSSKVLSVGPVAVVSILVATGIGAFAQPGSERYIHLAILLAAMVGVLQLGMGLLRAGVVVNLLAQPVLSAFTSAAALLIALSQVNSLFGFSMARSEQVHTLLSAVVAGLHETHGTTVVIGVATLLVLFAAKRWRPAFPGPLLVTCVGIVAAYVFDLQALGVSVVGSVPAGLPGLHLPDLELADVRALLSTALTIGLVGFIASISVAKAFAQVHRERVNANQELAALGLANLAAGMFQGFPITGGFARTAVNVDAGARSGVASLVTAAAIALALLFFTPVFAYLPNAVLAGIVITAVTSLFDWAEVRRLWKVKRRDLALWLVTFATTLFVGIEEGVAMGVIVSLATFFIAASRPNTAVLGRLPGTTIYRDVVYHPEAIVCAEVMVFRVDARLFFGNVDHLQACLHEEEERVRAQCDGLRLVVLDASAVNDLDSTADSMLHRLRDELEERGARLVIAHAKGPVRAVMERSGLLAALGEGGLTETVHEAVEAHVAKCAAE